MNRLIAKVMNPTDKDVYKGSGLAYIFTSWYDSFQSKHDSWFAHGEKSIYDITWNHYLSTKTRIIVLKKSNNI